MIIWTGAVAIPMALLGLLIGGEMIYFRIDEALFFLLYGIAAIVLDLLLTWICTRRIWSEKENIWIKFNRYFKSIKHDFSTPPTLFFFPLQTFGFLCLLVSIGLFVY